ncbi:hypothetical protein PAEPH01_1414 [Pancytospora epiphaga]|nr:hypothetical protein PAEPH01_1414 [Pancytospora epiphaga]
MGRFYKHTSEAIESKPDPEVTASKIDFNSAVLSNLNYTIILSFAFILILLKSYGKKPTQRGILHTRLQMLGGWILNFSILFSLIFSSSITLLSNKYTLPRHNIEVLKAFEGTFLKSYKGYSLDLAAVMTFSLKLSEILLISSLFFLLATLVPTGSREDEGLNKYNISNSSLGSFSILWGICRIPVHLYLDAYRSVFEGRLAMFLFDLISLAEIFIAAVILLILKVKRTLMLESSSQGDILILSLTLIFYGIFKYAVNLISMPFPVDELGVQAITSAQFSLELVLYLLASSFFVPREEVLQTRTQQSNSALDLVKPSLSNCDPDVVLLPPTIEFDNKIFSY